MGKVQLPTEDEPAVLIHGDCVEVLPKLRRGSVDAVVTDPPYNVGFVYDSHDDRMTEASYLKWLKQVWTACARAGARHIVWFWQGIRVANGDVVKVLPAGWRVHHLGAWYKREFAGDMWKGGHPAYCWEPIIWATSEAAVQFAGPKGGHAGRDCLVGNSSRHDRLAVGHPCPKTESVVRAVVGWIDAARILDPFAGSATVGAACLKSGKQFIGIESSEAYIQIGRRRLAHVEGRGGLFDPKMREMFV